MTDGHHFRVLPLRILEKREPDLEKDTWVLDGAPLPQKGVHLFYLHGPYLRNFESRPSLQPVLDWLGKRKEKRDPQNTIFNNTWWVKEEDFSPSPWQILNLYDRENKGVGLQDPSVYKSPYFDLVEQAIAAVHKAFNAREFDKGPLFIFAHATVWNAIFALSSRIDSYAGDEKGFHEYLLWDEGGGWSKATWPKDECKRLALAWSRFGWPSMRFKQFSRDTPRLDELVQELFDNTMHDLLLYEVLLGKWNAGETEAADSNPDTNNFVTDRRDALIGTLCEYLPEFWNQALETYRTPHVFGGSKGGPKILRSLSELSPEQRLLLFDGWLTPWYCATAEEPGWYLHPGSLAMLYWAAKAMAYPYGNLKPADFVNGYAWVHDAWFGGNLGAKKRRHDLKERCKWTD